MYRPTTRRYGPASPYAADRVARPPASERCACDHRRPDRTTGPGVVAAGPDVRCSDRESVEDSIFYRTARLLSAQEVGGDPANPSMSANEFHGINIARARDWPAALTATSTHDTKRSEDVRARIAMIAQVPGRWSILVRTVWRDAPPPEPLTGYFLLQNIIGVGRSTMRGTGSGSRYRAAPQATDYARKAAREGGIGTSWTAVDDGFETGWASGSTPSPPGRSQPRSVRSSASSPPVGFRNHWRKAIAVLGPGVPDIYQGTQWWDDSLVDPDNRRPWTTPDHRTVRPSCCDSPYRCAAGIRRRSVPATTCH